MPQLPRYAPKRVAPQTGGTAGIQAQAQMFDTLADRIDSFQGQQIQKYAQETTVEAKQDAESAFAQRGMQAQVNKDMTVYGQTYTNALTNMHKKQLAIDTGVAIENAYNKNKNNPIAFQTEAESIYTKTSELLPDHLKADYAIDFEANKAHYAGEVYGNRIRLDKERDVALTNELFMQSSQKSTKAARDGNHDLSLYEMEKGIKGLDSALENTTITADQHRKGVANIKFDTSTSTFKGVNDKHLSEDDLQGSQDYIDAFRSSTPEGFDDQQREKLADDMQGDLNKQIRLTKVTDTASKEEAAIAVSDAIKIYKTGKEPLNYKEVKESAVLVSLKQQHELAVAEAAYKINQKVDYLTLPEQAANVNTIEAKPGASRIDIDALALAKKNLSEKIQMAEKDPYSLGVQDGLYEQAGTLLPSQGLGAIAQTLPTRASQSKIAQAAYGTVPKLFSDAEAQRYSTWLENPTTSIKDKLDFIETIEESVPNESSLVYDQLQKKGASVFAFAGSMLKKGDRQKAEMMLRGQIILREQPGVVPFQDMQWKLNGTIGDALRYEEEGPRKALSEASTAYYAALAEQEGKLSKESAPLALVNKAVQDITGGVGEKNDQNYFLPPGATEDDVDDWLDDLTTDDFADVRGITPEDAVDLIQRGQIISVGDGKYQIIFQGKRLMSTDGTPLVMEYTK